MLHQVGAGALGPVFRAFDADRHRLVAIKLFRPGPAADRLGEFVAALERLAAVDLRHAGIAAPIAAGRDGVDAYLAQEFAAGDSLDEIVRDHGPVPAADALRVAAQLSAALDFAADSHVYHGAMHPRDVRLTVDGARLTGLGVAAALEQVGVAPPARRPYAAPERVAGGAWDRRADVFSLAALVHELLWARPGAGAGERAADARTHVPGAHPPTLRAVFARALAERPDDRFATAGELADALEAAFRPIGATAPSGGRSALDARILPMRDAAPGIASFTSEHEIDESNAVIDAGPPMAAEGPQRPDDRLLTADDEAVDLDVPASALRMPDDDLELRIAERPLEDDLVHLPVAVLPTAVLAAGRVDDYVEQLPLIDVEERVSAAPLLFSRIADHPETPAASSRALRVAAIILAALVAGFGGGYFVGVRLSVVSGTAPARSANEPSEAAPPKTDSMPSPSPVQPPPSAAAEAVTDTPILEARPPADAAPPAVEIEAGHLSVRSTPSGASVLVDGRPRGLTPLTLTDLVPGTHRLRVARPGFATQDRSVVISAGEPSEPLTVALERPRAAGSSAPEPLTPRTPATLGVSTGGLTVDSRPTGASVFLDGRLVGRTPLEMDEVAAGEHAVRLDHDGYRGWSSSFRIASGERRRVTASLEEIER